MLNIFLTNLGKYNEGLLIGEWVELPADAETIEAVKARIGINAMYEETFISDYETDISGLKINEFSDLEELNQMAESLANMDETEKMVLGAMIGNFTFQEAIEKIEEGNFSIYSDCFDMEDVARCIVDDGGLIDQIPDYLRQYFDYAAYARDLEIDGGFVFLPGGYCIEIFD